MIAVDTNILVYAHREDSPFHEKAYQCILGLAENIKPWTIPFPCIHEFLAIVTHPKIYKPPTSMLLALKQVEAWLESPSLVLIGESNHYWHILSSILKTSNISGAQIHDARIAAICMYHNVNELLSADRDFSHFSELKIRNPILIS